ncbi:hypothetical protein ISU93_19880 [Enterobacter hormaechei]|uniref:hypothetical protein n=1 Tax=Enterobacter hormaechei TaxID=158836 RepID=UPI00188B2E22|nr:hypothetical protein [Enterobacter hormaechei]MBF4154931.1 hypothetical protein [Enterobacter hormaechei]
MFIKTTITLVFSMFLVCFSAHADFVIRQDIDWEKGSDVNLEDYTWGSFPGYDPTISGENRVTISNSKAIFDRNCLYFTSDVFFEFRNSTPIQVNSLIIPLGPSTLLDVGNKDLGAVKDLVTDSLGGYYIVNRSMGYALNNQIKNKCETVQTYDFSGILSLGTDIFGQSNLTMPFRLYGTVQPERSCSINLPSTLDIGNYNVETINGKYAELIANVSCTQNGSVNIKITSQQTLADDKSCMLTSRYNDLLFCITMNSLPVDLTGNTGVNIVIGPSGSTLVLGAKARTMGDNVAGEHRGELVVTITPI